MTGLDLQNLLFEELGYQEAPDLLAYNSNQQFVNPLPDVQQVYYVKNVPVAYFSRLDEADPDRLLELHKSIWNESKVPLLYVILPQEIRVYNTYAEPPRFASDLDNSTERLLEHLTDLVNVEKARQDIQSHLTNSYSRLYLETGAFWNTIDGQKIKRESRADQRLLGSIRGACNYLIDRGLKSGMAFGLVGRSIFIRYLEDRSILTPEQIADWTKGKAQNYFEALNDRATIYNLFKALNRQFNGDMFPPSEAEETVVEEQHLAGLRIFLMGEDFETGQGSFWPYDFRYVPKELISGIYDTFLYPITEEENSQNTRRLHGTYYTPLPLVDFVIEETLPLELTQTTMTVLDPACGSGVFLVRAYQRLIEAWIEQTKQRPNPTQLVELLQGHIFGMDIEPRAVQIAAFSLYMALLDNLDNDEIEGNNFRFPSLKHHNLFDADFFKNKAVEWLGNRKFDRIIGNLPWGRGTLTPEAKKRAQESGFEVGGKQIDQAFLAVVPNYCAEDGEIALIAGAKSIIHVTSNTLEKFRQQFFERFHVRAVVNFSVIRFELFDKAVGPSAVFFYQPTPPRSDKLVYCIPKPSLLSQRLKAIVLDSDQIKYLDRQELVDFPELWKISAWGTQRDAALIKLLKNCPSLEQQAFKLNWKISEGFFIGTNGKEANWLKGKPLIEIRKLNPYFTYTTDRVDNLIFERSRTPDIYQTPLALIRRSTCECSIFDTGFVAYKDKITGIVGQPDHVNLLKWVAVYINSYLTPYYHFLTSTSWGVERGTISQSDYKTMPFIIPNEEKLNYIVSHFDQIVNLFKELLPNHVAIEAQKTALNKLVYEVFDLTSSEQQLVEDTITYTIPYFDWATTKGRKPDEIAAIRQPDELMLKAYAETFTEIVKKLLRYSGKTLNATVYRDGAPLSVVEFEPVALEEARDIKVIENSQQLRTKLKELDKLLLEQQTETLYMQRQVRIYQQDRFYLIRPSEQRFWTRSQARADADQFIAEQLSQTSTETKSVSEVR